MAAPLPAAYPHRSIFSFVTSALRALLLIAGVLVIRGEVRATHAMGGQLTYTYAGANQYLVTLKFYRDCNGVAAPTTCTNGLEFNVRSAACGANFNQCLALQSVQVITPICATEIDRCTSASGTYGIEEYTYTSLVNLSTWANCGTDWIVSWELCCRNNAITSLVNPGGQRLYLDTRINNTIAPKNNSATFTNPPTPFYCIGQPITYNPGAIDPDGDVLQFALINARGINGTNLAYNAGYSALQPINNTGGANAVALDPTTGTLTCVPAIQQVAVVTYRVREFRGGVQVGEITRDIQFVVRACPGNSQPVASGINGTGNFSTSVCAGTPITFTINGSDPNAGQQVNLAWNSGIPGGSFVVGGTPTNPVATFSWTPTVANLGNNVFTVTATDNACPLVGTADYGYSITVTPPFTAANAGPDQNVCGTGATLAAVQPYPGAPGQWSVVTGSGTFSNINDPGATVAGLSQGTNTFAWTIDYLTCGVAADQVTITSYNPGQAAANAGPDQSLCLPTTSATLAGNIAAAPALGTWTQVAGPTATITSPNSPTSTVTGLGGGVSRFRWTINNGPCGTPTFDEVEIFLFSNLQGIANAGPDQSICTPQSSVTLSGNALIAPATGQWTQTGGAAATIASPTSATTAINGLTAGVYTFQWTISNGPCAPPSSSDQVTITVFSDSSPVANAGVDQEVCSPPAAITLTGSVPVFPSSGQWTLVSGGGTIASASSPTTTVSGLPVGVSVFQWTVDNGPCASGVTSDQVSVTVFDGANAAANAGPDQNICGTITTATMAANTPTAPASGTWSILLGTGTIVSPNDPSTVINGLSVGENRFRWTTTNGPCAGSSTFDEVSIFLYDPNQAAADAGADQELCLPQTSTNLTGNAVTFPATGQWTVVNGTGSFGSPNAPNTTVSGLSVGVNTFAWTINNGPCANPITTDEVVVTVFDDGQPAANAGSDQQLCSPQFSTNLQGSIVTAPATGAWSLVSGTATITDPVDPNTSVTGLVVGTAVFRWTVSNGPCAGGLTQDDVVVEVFDANNPIANAGPDQDLCTPASSTTMAGSSVIAPAVGTWSLVSGGGSITDPNDPNTTITGLPVGVNVFEWEVDNGSCATGITTDQVVITVYDATVPVANAGPDREICVPTFPNQVGMTASTVAAPGVGTWTLISGGGNIADPNDPNTLVDNLPVGINVFQWTVDNGACGPVTSDQVTVFVFDAANPIANAGPDQSVCTPITSAQLDGSELIVPATGQWTVSSGTGTFADPTDPNTIVSGLSLGANVFTWTVSNGPCLPGMTLDQVTITLFSGSAQAADAGVDQELCSTSPFTVLTGNTPVFPATGVWTVVQGGGSTLTPGSPSASFSGLTVGENIFEWSINNGACGTSTDQVSVFVYDVNQAAASAGPDQNICTPANTVTMAANATTFPAVGTWTLISGAGNIVAPNDPATLITGLGVGINVFEWTIDNGPCPGAVTSDQVVINVFDSTMPVANAGQDLEICSTTLSVQLSGSAIVPPANGTWVLINGAALISDVQDPNATVSGLGVGVNTFQWFVFNGPCGSSFDEVSITVFDENNPAANAGSDQEKCTPDTTAVMAATPPIFPATGSWTLVSGSGIFADPADPASAVTGLTIGQNVFAWTVSNGPCANPVTVDAMIITVYDQNEPAANAGPDQSYCTPQDTAVLAATTTTFPASGTWTLVQGTGNFADPGDPTTTVSGLSVGENIFQWEVYNGPCPGSPSPDQVSIFIYDANNPVADAGPDQQLCTPTDSTTLAGSNVIFPASGVWTVVQGTGVFANASDPNTAVTGLAVGENIFQWSVTNGPCANPLTQDLVSVFLFDDLNPVADAGPDQDLCTPNINATMAGSSVTFPAIGTWTLVSGAGTIADANDPATVISDLGVGENVFAWTVDNGPCASGITSDTVHVFLYDQNNANADAGTDQELCLPVTSTTLAGSPVTFPATGLWTIVSGTGVLADPTDPNTTISGLVVGEVVVDWTVTNGPCGAPTSDQMSIFLFDDTNPDANAGPDQSMCTPDNFATMAGSAVTFPATGNWTLVSGTGTIVAPGDPNTNIFDLSVGANVFAWTVDNGPCANGITSDTVTLYLYDAANPIADAGPDQDLCTPQDSALLAGSPVTFPATGAWSVMSGAGVFNDPSDPSTTVTGLAPGPNVFAWTVDNGPCESGITMDLVTITLYDSGNPVADAGPDQQLCTPDTFTVMAGSNVIFPATGTWTLAGGTGVIADPTDPNTAISGLSIGENIFLWSVSNGPCGTPTSEDLVSIFVFDSAQVDAGAGPDQNICTPITSATMAGTAYVFPSTGTWSVVSGAGTIVDPADPLTEITDLGIGVNEFAWTVDNGPCGAGITSDTVTINLFDLNAPPAAAGPDQSFCYPDTFTVLAGNPPTGAGTGQWTVTQGTGVFADDTDPTTAVSGLSIGENIFTWTLVNGVCGTSTDAVSIFIYDPLSPPANAGPDVEICVPQDSINLSGNTPTFPAIGTWTQIEGAGLFADVNDPTSLVVGLAIGANTFVWTVDNGPCANPITTDTMTVILYDDSTEAPNAGPDLEICLPNTQVNLQAATPLPPADGTWTLIGGVGTIVDPTDSATLVTDLAVGISTFVWTLDLSPCANSGVLSDTMTVSVFDPAAPPADAGPDQELCTPATSATLAGNVPIFPATGTWSVISGGAAIADTTDPATTVTGLTLGDNLFVWEIYNGNCGLGPNITYDTVNVILYDATTPGANAGADQEFCQPDTTAVMQANTVVYPAQGTWTVIAGNGSFLDPNDPNTLVTGLGVGENIFQWEIANGPCPNGTTLDQVSVFIYDDDQPAADAGPDQEICVPTMPSTISMAGNAPIFPATGQWTLVSGGGTITDPSDPATTVTDLPVGINVFEWTIDNGPCPNAITTDQVQIIVFDAASPDASAGPDQELCTPSSATSLAGNVPTFPAQGYWTVISGGGTLSDPNDPSATISALAIGQTVLTWTVENGPCPNALTVDTMVINVFDGNAADADAGPDQDFCTPTPDPVTMSANSPVFPAIGTWVLISGSGIIADAGDPATAISGLGLGANVFEWSIDNGDCGTSNDQVTITVFDSSIPPADAGESQYFCSHQFNETYLDAVPATSTGTGAWSQWVDGAWVPVGGDPDQLITGGLSGGNNIFQWTISNGPCPATSDTMIVLLDDCLSLVIPNAFSPNGDGTNDLYVIQNLESYPNNRIMVFNRWGSKVLDRSPYRNDWDGRSENSLNWGEELPEGTYFFILDLGDGTDEFTGYIYLKR